MVFRSKQKHGGFFNYVIDTKRFRLEIKVAKRAINFEAKIRDAENNEIIKECLKTKDKEGEEASRNRKQWKTKTESNDSRRIAFWERQERVVSYVQEKKI